MRRIVYVTIVFVLIFGFIVSQLFNHKQVAEADLVESPSTFEELSIMS